MLLYFIVQKAFNNNKLIYNTVQCATNETILRMKFGEIFKLNFGNKNKKPMEERYYFHAFNGCYEKTFMENGLGNITGLDSSIIDAFKLLEDELGRLLIRREKFI